MNGPIETMTKTATQEITAEVLAEIADLCERRGLTVKLDKARYTPTTGTCDITFTFGIASIDSGRIEWDLYCGRYDLTPEDYGKKVVLNGKAFTLAGFRPRAPKRPILATGDDGRTYSLSAGPVVAQRKGQVVVEHPVTR